MAPSLLTREMLAQRSVDARLPTRPAGAEPFDHILIETQRYEFLRTIERRAAAPAADQPVTNIEIGLFEELVGQLRDVLVLLGLDLVGVQLSQVGVSTA